QMFPEQPVYYQTRGRLRIRSENYEQALPDFEQALAYEPNLVSARIGMVEAYRGLEQHDKAREQLDIIRSTPSGLNEFLQLQLDMFLEEQARFDEVLDEYDPQAG
ncbi:MAG: tetratricopeptide repeat protein, partial [Planctomycetota bacterium]